MADCPAFQPLYPTEPLPFWSPSNVPFILTVVLVFLLCLAICGLAVLSYVLWRLANKHQDTERQIDFLKKHAESTAHRISSNSAKEGESAEWWNMFVYNAWNAGLLAKLERQLRASVEHKLERGLNARNDDDTARKVPNWIRTFTLDRFSLGIRPPVVTKVKVVTPASKTSTSDPEGTSGSASPSEVHLDVDLAINSEELDVVLTAYIHTQIHKMLDSMELLQRHGGDTQLTIRVQQVHMAGTMSVRLIGSYGFMLFGFKSPPSCRLKINVEANTRSTGYSFSVPITRVPGVVEFLEGMVQNDLSKDLMWPRFNAIDLIPDPFSLPAEAYRGTVKVHLVAMRDYPDVKKGEVKVHLVAMRDYPDVKKGEVKLECKWAGGLKERVFQMDTAQDGITPSNVFWGQSFTVTLTEQVECLLFDLSFKDRKSSLPTWEKSSLTWSSSPEHASLRLGSGFLKVMGLPHGAAVVTTTSREREPLVTAVTASGSPNADTMLRPHLKLSPLAGSVETWVQLLPVRRQDPRARSRAESAAASDPAPARDDVAQDPAARKGIELLVRLEIQMQAPERPRRPPGMMLGETVTSRRSASVPSAAAASTVAAHEDPTSPDLNMYKSDAVLIAQAGC